MAERWTIEKAQDCAHRQPWFFGASFYPSTAVNQLKMWQKETFDPVSSERELGYAQRIGMNIMRVYLHDLPKTQQVLVEESEALLLKEWREHGHVTKIIAPIPATVAQRRQRRLPSPGRVARVGQHTGAIR